MNIQKNILKIARKILADYDYIYDPEHKKNPGEGYERTEKGWSKDKSEKNENEKNGMTDEQKKLHEMATSKDVDTVLKALHSKEIHPDSLDAVKKSFPVEVASHNNTSRKTLDELSTHRSNEVRTEVAANPHTDLRTLKKIFQYKWEIPSVQDLAKRNFDSRKQEAAQKNRVFLTKLFDMAGLEGERYHNKAINYALEIYKGGDKKKIIDEINSIIPRTDVEVTVEDLL